MSRDAPDWAVLAIEELREADRALERPDYQLTDGLLRQMHREAGYHVARAQVFATLAALD